MKNANQNKIICQMIDELDLAIGLNSEIESKDLKHIKQNLHLLIEKLNESEIEVVNSSALSVPNKQQEEKIYLHPFQGFYPVLN